MVVPFTFIGCREKNWGLQVVKKASCLQYIPIYLHTHKLRNREREKKKKKLKKKKLIKPKGERERERKNTTHSHECTYRGSFYLLCS